MTVANHISWLDIFLIAACEDTRFVAKSDVGHWPLVNLLVNAAGSFYLNRGGNGGRSLLNRLIPHLRRGGSFTVFPEGTTTDGSAVLPFYPRLFGAAIEAHCPVQPVFIHYEPAANGTAVAPFIGDDTLVAHLLRLLRVPELRAELSYAAPLHSHGMDRETLARAARTAIESGLRSRTPVTVEPASSLESWVLE
ncbi:MAG: 1-acyl-sn-glycerol-3-phosphate acyltransferase [Nevskiales bacterium]|nr:1-acyl-sn-glycerol-3-phosphate acyltransferase [Nevskiales bacterium]